MAGDSLTQKRMAGIHPDLLGTTKVYQDNVKHRYLHNFKKTHFHTIETVPGILSLISLKPLFSISIYQLITRKNSKKQWRTFKTAKVKLRNLALKLRDFKGLPPPNLRHNTNVTVFGQPYPPSRQGGRAEGRTCHNGASTHVHKLTRTGGAPNE